MAAVAEIVAPRARKPRHPLVAFVLTQPLGAAGALVVLVMALAALGADFVAPYDPEAIDFASMLGAPSLDHPLGTDAFGRDVLSGHLRRAHRAGDRLSLVLPRQHAGRPHRHRRRLFPRRFRPRGAGDHRHPALLPDNHPGAGGGGGARQGHGLRRRLVPDRRHRRADRPNVARVVRSAALAIREMPYIDAARAAGFSDTRIIFRHMAPNVAAPYLIMVTAFIAQAILLEASLSFLGLGVVEPTPSWGLMLSGHAADFYHEAPG